MEPKAEVEGKVEEVGNAAGFRFDDDPKMRLFMGILLVVERVCWRSENKNEAGAGESASGGAAVVGKKRRWGGGEGGGEGGGGGKMVAPLPSFAYTEKYQVEKDRVMMCER